MRVQSIYACKHTMQQPWVPPQSYIRMVCVKVLQATLWPHTYKPLGGIGMCTASTNILPPMSRSGSPYSNSSTGRHLHDPWV